MTLVPRICSGLLLAASALAVDGGLLDLAPPDANFAIGVRVDRIVQSPLVDKALAEARASHPDVMAFLAGGSAPFAGLEEILIVGRAEPEADEQAREDALALLRGDFTNSRLLNAACREGCSTTTYAGFEILSATNQATPADFVVLDERYAAAGAPRRVREAIERRLRGERSPFAAEVAEWSNGIGRRAIWLAATGPFDPPPGAQASGLSIQGVDKIDGIGFGLDPGQELDIALELRTADEAGAQELYDAAQGLLALMALGAQGADPDDPKAQAAQWLQKLELTHQPRRLLASLRVPADDVWEQIEAGVTKAAKGEDVFGSRSQPRAAPTPRARQGVIRIYGLEAEPVVVESGNEGALPANAKRNSR